MENKLNKWFDAARNNPPMISILEVEAMISNPPAAKGGFLTVSKIIFMGMVILTIASWLYCVNIGTVSDSNIQSNGANPATPVKETQAKDLIQEHLTKRPMNIAAGESERVMPFEIDIEKNVHDITKEQNPLGYYPAGIIISVNSPTITISDGIELTQEELARLGIITDGNVLEYQNINGMLSNSDTIHSIFHLHVEKHGSRRASKGHPDIGGKLKGVSKSFWPAAIQVVSDKDTSLTIVENMYADWEQSFFSETKQYLIPVLTTTIAKPGKYSHDLQLIFWFKPEPDFFAALPTAIAAILMKEYPVSVLEKYKLIYGQYVDKMKGMARVARIDGFDSVRVALLKKKYLMLSEHELKKLNIKKLSGGVRYENRFHQNGRLNEVKFRRRGYYMATMVNDKMYWVKRIRKRDKPYTAVAVTSPDLTRVTYLYVYPDSIGYTKQHQMSKSLFSKEVENMIPIQADDQTVFWFPETEDLMKVLNERGRR